MHSPGDEDFFFICVKTETRHTKSGSWNSRKLPNLEFRKGQGCAQGNRILIRAQGPGSQASILTQPNSQHPVLNRYKLRDGSTLFRRERWMGGRPWRGAGLIGMARNYQKGKQWTQPLSLMPQVSCSPGSSIVRDPSPFLQTSRCHFHKKLVPGRLEEMGPLWTEFPGVL